MTSNINSWKTNGETAVSAVTVQVILGVASLTATTVVSCTPTIEHTCKPLRVPLCPAYGGSNLPQVLNAGIRTRGRVRAGKQWFVAVTFCVGIVFCPFWPVNVSQRAENTGVGVMMCDLDDLSGSQQVIFIYPLAKLSPDRVSKAFGHAVRGSAVSSAFLYPNHRTTYGRWVPDRPFSKSCRQCRFCCLLFDVPWLSLQKVLSLATVHIPTGWLLVLMGLDVGLTVTRWTVIVFSTPSFRVRRALLFTRISLWGPCYRGNCFSYRFAAGCTEAEWKSRDLFSKA